MHLVYILTAISSFSVMFDYINSFLRPLTFDYQIISEFFHFCEIKCWKPSSAS